MNSIQQKFAQYFLQAPFQVQNDGRLLMDIQYSVKLFDYYKDDGYVKPEMIKYFRRAYALCMLQREGIDSKDLNLQEQIAEFTFEKYPFMFRLSEMSLSYLYFIFKRYEPGYVFIRCSMYQEEMFDFRRCMKKWSSDNIFKLTSDGHALYIKMPSTEELRIPFQAVFKEEIVQNLGLVHPYPEYIFNRVFTYCAYRI